MKKDEQTCGSTTIPPDLLGYREWLRQVDHGSKTWKVLDAFIDEIVTDYESGIVTKSSDHCIPWSRVSERFAARRDDEPPSALSKVLKHHTMENWFNSRSEGYNDFCQQRGYSPLKFHSYNSGSGIQYGFILDENTDAEEMPRRIQKSVMTWERRRVPSEDMRWIAQKLMPNGERLMRGPARWIFISYIMSLILFQIVIFAMVFLSALFLEQSFLKTFNILIWTGIGISFAWLILKPKARQADQRTMPAWNWFLLKEGPDAWIDSIRVPVKDGPEGAYESKWQLVRWLADCPICGAEIELRRNSHIRPGELTGCCMDSCDEHSFTFDRVTLEGRPLRSTPRIN